MNSKPFFQSRVCFLATLFLFSSVSSIYDSAATLFIPKFCVKIRWTDLPSHFRQLHNFFQWSEVDLSDANYVFNIVFLRMFSNFCSCSRKFRFISLIYPENTCKMLVLTEYTEFSFFLCFFTIFSTSFQWYFSSFSE